MCCDCAFDSVAPCYSATHFGVRNGDNPARWQWIPTNLTLEQFEQFVLLHLSTGSRGPAPKLPAYTIFNYILQFLYRGCQWEQLPINKNEMGHPEIHYTRHHQPGWRLRLPAKSKGHFQSQHGAQRPTEPSGKKDAKAGS